MAQVAGGPRPPKVGFIHTTPPTIGMVERYMKECLPGTVYVHVYDGNVKIDNFRSPIGQTPKANLLRFAVFADQLERAGCDLIASCCSLMPRATAFAAQVVSVPFIQLDAVILDRAVAQFQRIGVINTTAYTVPYLEEGLRDRAARLGKQIQIEFSNTESALDLFNAGELEEHDRIVLRDVRKLSEQGVDCVLMGQIPFALMDQKLEGLSLRVPVLYAGREAFQRVKDLLEKRADVSRGAP
jgi:aspartate/glutamate racemase